MKNTSVAMEPDARLILVSSSRPLPSLPSAPFVAMLPAFDLPERERGLSIVSDLLNAGCVEFCCAGPEAELLHDSLDEQIERAGKLDVVTTWHRDPEDACDYFLYAAGAGQLARIALVAEHAELAELLSPLRVGP